MTYLLHVGNVLYILAFLVKDMVWLRALSIAGGTSMVLAYVARSPPMWDGAGWDALFVVINLVQLGLLLAQRRPVKLTAEEQRLYAASFRSLTPREWKTLVDKGKRETFTAGAHVVERGKELDVVRVVAEGTVEVRDGDRVVCALGIGQFVGEMAFLSGEHPKADVVAREDVTFIAWPAPALRRALEDDVDLRAQVQTILGHDLMRKLQPSER